MLINGNEIPVSGKNETDFAEVISPVTTVEILRGTVRFFLRHLSTIRIAIPK